MIRVSNVPIGVLCADFLDGILVTVFLLSIYEGIEVLAHTIRKFRGVLATQSLTHGGVSAMPEKFDLLGEISVLDANLLLNWLDMVTLERDEAQLVVNHIIDRLLAINGDVDSKVVRNLAAALWRAESILRFS